MLRTRLGLKKKPGSKRKQDIGGIEVTAVSSCAPTKLKFRKKKRKVDSDVTNEESNRVSDRPTDENSVKGKFKTDVQEIHVVTGSRKKSKNKAKETDFKLNPDTNKKDDVDTTAATDNLCATSSFSKAAKKRGLNSDLDGKKKKRERLSSGNDQATTDNKKAKRLKRKEKKKMFGTLQTDMEMTAGEKFTAKSNLTEPKEDPSNVDTTDDNADECKTKKDRQELVRRRLTEKRLEKGLVMLSRKAESKIFRLKKRLQKKGLPAEEIKNIIRQKRRSEELTFRSENRPGNNMDVCYRCRKPGHRFADCKLVVEDTDQGTGVCFRCGSTEHILRDCPCKSNRGKLPFAKCFVCGKQGHLSRDCPSNPFGAFPKGGKCSVCGSINHLKRDCPKLQQSQQSDEYTVRAAKAGLSIDALDDE